jgi:hypothetical protein
MTNQPTQSQIQAAGTQRAYTLDDALTDLALARRDNGRLADENARLRAQVTALLGGHCPGCDAPGCGGAEVS